MEIETPKEEVGRTLREARGRLGLSKREMAEALNTGYETYVKWERGARAPQGLKMVGLLKAVQRLEEVPKEA